MRVKKKYIFAVGQNTNLNMKKKVIMLIIFVVSIVLFSGCPIGSDANKTVYNYTPNDELYDYCAFDEASYWLYEDSATHEIDSVVVLDFYKTSCSTDIVVDEKHHKYEGLINTFYQNYDVINQSRGTEYSVFMHPMVYYPNPKFSEVELDQYEYYYLENTHYFYSGCPYMFAYTNLSKPIASNTVRTPGYDVFRLPDFSIKYLAFYDNYYINGYNYNDVKKIEFLNNAWTQDTIVCYWAKYVGLVRQEYSNDSVKVVKNIKYHSVINVRNQYK